MNCAWQDYLYILPSWLRQEADKHRLTLLETRLRINRETEFVTRSGSFWLSRPTSSDDLNFCINSATKYSPWNAATSSQGYITAPGGHRIGVCGEVVVKDKQPVGIRNLTSLCIRVARDFPGIAENADNIRSDAIIMYNDFFIFLPPFKVI